MYLITVPHHLESEPRQGTTQKSAACQKGSEAAAACASSGVSMAETPGSATGQRALGGPGWGARLRDRHVP